MDTDDLLPERKPTTQVAEIDLFLVEVNLGDILLFRLIEVTLSNQINPLPFHLQIWSNRSCMDELENCSNRYYHLEEISVDEIDLGKDTELIPVAHYTKVIGSRSNEVDCISFLFFT